MYMYFGTLEWPSKVQYQFWCDPTQVTYTSSGSSKQLLVHASAILDYSIVKQHCLTCISVHLCHTYNVHDVHVLLNIEKLNKLQVQDVAFNVTSEIHVSR